MSDTDTPKETPALTTHWCDRAGEIVNETGNDLGEGVERGSRLLGDMEAELNRLRPE